MNSKIKLYFLGFIRVSAGWPKCPKIQFVMTVFWVQNPGHKLDIKKDQKLVGHVLNSPCTAELTFHLTTLLVVWGWSCSFWEGHDAPHRRPQTPVRGLLLSVIWLAGVFIQARHRNAAEAVKAITLCSCRNCDRLSVMRRIHRFPHEGERERGLRGHKPNNVSRIQPVMEQRMLKVCVSYMSQLFSAMFEPREIHRFYIMSSMSMKSWGKGTFIRNLKWVKSYFMVAMSKTFIHSNCNHTHVQLSTVTRVPLLEAILFLYDPCVLQGMLLAAISLEWNDKTWINVTKRQ